LKKHNEEIILKFREACYVIKELYLIIIINSLKSIYFACFHSVTKYGMIFLGNLPSREKIFTLQKKTISIMVGAKPRTQSRSLMEEIGDFTYIHTFHRSSMSIDSWIWNKPMSIADNTHVPEMTKQNTCYLFHVNTCFP